MQNAELANLGTAPGGGGGRRRVPCNLRSRTRIQTVTTIVCPATASSGKETPELPTTRRVSRKTHRHIITYPDVFGRKHAGGDLVRVLLRLGLILLHRCLIGSPRHPNVRVERKCGRQSQRLQKDSRMGDRSPSHRREPLNEENQGTAKRITRNVHIQPRSESAHLRANVHWVRKQRERREQAPYDLQRGYPSGPLRRRQRRAADDPAPQGSWAPA